MAVVLTAVEQPGAYPPRVQLTATGLTNGDVITITRTTAGDPTPTTVRAADAAVVIGTAIVLNDAEQPFGGVALTYSLTVNGALITTAVITPTNITTVALTDAIAGTAVDVTILAWPEKSTARRATVYTVGRRNIVVSDQRSQPTSTIEVFTETETARRLMIALLDSATSGIIQIRQGTPGFYGIDGYFAVPDDTEVRWSPDAADERRRWRLSLVEVDAWGGGLESSTWTLQDIADAYTGLTLTDFAGDYADLIAAAQGDYS